MAKKIPSKPSSASAVTTPEEALAYVAQTEGPDPLQYKTTTLAQNSPAEPKGYEPLGKATDPRAGKQRIKP